MTPLPDRIVILGLVLAVGICFALAAWTAIPACRGDSNRRSI